MRRISIPRPFSGGYRTEVPDYAINLNEASYSIDMTTPVGIARQRWGWSYVDDEVVGLDIAGVARASFAVSGNTYTVASVASNGRIYKTNSGAPGTVVWSNPDSVSTHWLPRCVYNGELIFCAQDGKTPLLRYGGSSTSTRTSQSSTLALGVGSMTFTTGSTFSASKGSFVSVQGFASGAFSKNPAMSARIIETNGTTSFTVDSLRNKTTTAASITTTAEVGPIGYAYPAVAINESGKVTTSGTTATFEGTNWTSSNVSDKWPRGDSVLVINPTIGSPHEISDVASVDSTTQLTVRTGLSSFSNAQYKLLRRCPFKDATVHRGSLWGTGVDEYPSRVYVFIPTKDIGLPPTAEKPFDPTLQAGYASANVTGFTRTSDFLAGAYDVPGPYDSTPVVAVLSSAGPLLALKSDAVFAMYGTYDSTNPSSIEVTRISDGSGCVDLRSAVTVKSIPYWAGRDGIYMYRGSIADITEGKIKQEWQSLMLGYVQGTSYVSCGVVADTYLVVSAGGLDNTKTGDAKLGPDTSNPSDRTFVFDIKAGVWLGRMSNAKFKQMWTVGVEDGANALLATHATYSTRVIDVLPAFFGGSVSDADGSVPSFTAWSSAALGQAEGVEGETRLCDAIFHTNLLDSSPASSAFSVSVVSGGQLNDQATTTKALSPIYADTVDRVDRSKRVVNRSGRLHQIRVSLTAASTNLNSEIPEMLMSFRDSRRGT